MQHYFDLQLKLTNRKLIEFGVKPFIAYGLIGILFSIGSLLLFYKTEYALWIYLGLMVHFSLMLAERERNLFLRRIYPKKHYQQLRLLENLVLAIPFCLFLIYKQMYGYAIGFGVLASVLSLFNNQSSLSIVIPTPFYRFPYEFTIGFRRYFLLTILATIINIIAISVGNYNLFAVTLMIIALICASYYQHLEPKFFIWIHQKSSSQFLKSKIKYGLFYLTLLFLPFLACSVYFFYEFSQYTLLIMLLGYLYLTTMILAKYIRYPRKINLMDSIIIGICFVCFPFMIPLIIIYYRKSSKQLKLVLNDHN